MVEFVLVAFMLAVGILGLTMLQVMSMRGSRGSRAMNTAVMVGEGVLESIQAEGRQRMLFLKFTGVVPETTYFGTTAVVQRYAFDGTRLADDATNAFFTVTVDAPIDVVPLSTAGGTKRFTLTIAYADRVDPTDSTRTINRTVTLTRQVAYA